jgi:hypothetical protein
MLFVTIVACSCDSLFKAAVVSARHDIKIKYNKNKKYNKVLKGKYKMCKKEKCSFLILIWPILVLGRTGWNFGFNSFY